MTILMVALERKFGSFLEFNGSNWEASSNGKSRDNKDIKEDPKKERPSSSSNTSSYSLFKWE